MNSNVFDKNDKFNYNYNIKKTMQLGYPINIYEILS